MKEELSNRLLSSLDFIGTFLKEGANLASREVPLLIQEVLTYNLYIAFLGILVGLILLTLGLYFVYKFKKAEYDDKGAYFGGLFISLFASAIILYGNTSSVIKIKYAPRLYIITEMKDLIK